ncbi:hypothetical protein ECHLIB_0993 [Ehrlichia chaffeensis str. Liberty]|nr:hypothetical protein ECHJAX_0992 [Ehrlichia chaffeensis str. Jax]AHX07024.1 hypothetical protein ECHLIB_0993 [Ehrlichia chaffeensis str. Liberty]AHX08006.1 hypothetical protein ECHOSC_0986 [Ehrlichia chaffeensis str. Osceola]AHX10568.1 hypothetical protein ECHWP_0966 [Ehrlichia chaffeensis str. West Paces]
MKDFAALIIDLCCLLVIGISDPNILVLTSIKAKYLFLQAMISISPRMHLYRCFMI